MAEPPENPFDRVLPGIPPWLMEDYFRDVGAVQQPDGWFSGPGWRGRVMPAEDRVLGSLRVGQIRLQIEGEPEAFRQVMKKLELKLIRGGG